MLGWPGRLPAPILAGERATYRDVTPGVDLVIESRRSGYEEQVVIRDRAALQNLITAAAGQDVSWTLPVRTKGLTARAEGDDSVSFVDTKGKVISRFAAPVAWDATVDPASGDRTNLAPVQVKVAQHGKGAATLTLTPNQAWLTDPARTFPMTIDPTYVTGTKSYAMLDTHVQKQYPTGDRTGETELKVGTANSRTDASRTFIKFGFTNFKNLQIMSASLSLQEVHSYSCTAKPFYVYSSASIADPTALTWSNQPSASTQYGSLTVAKGYSSSCAAGRVSVPITALVASWASNAYSTGWLRLSASETDNYGWKKFASSETSTNPYITFTYNRKPNTASAPTVTPGYSYTPPGGTAAVYTSALKPTLKATATDPDANKVLFKIEVHSNKSGSAPVTSCTTALVASGSTGSCALASNLTNNTEYHVRTAVQDDQGLWNGTWSPWTTFRIGSTAPAAPSIICSAPYTNGSSHAGAPGTPIGCTIDAPGTSWSAASAINVSLDGGAAKPYSITPSSSESVARATVTIPNTNGTHTLTATASNPAQVSGSSASYIVILGAPSMQRPATGTSSTGNLPVVATMLKPAGTLTGHIQWRLAGDNAAAWVDDPGVLPVNPTPGNSTTIDVGGTWDIASITGTNISGRTPVTFEARACITTIAAVDTCLLVSAQNVVTRLPNAFGAGYPVDASSGAGSVALFTGEFSTSASDVSVRGLGLGRFYESMNGDQSANDTVRGVFGPGWTGDFGTASGWAGWTVADTTFADGRIGLVDPASGDTLTFARPDGTRTYPATDALVTYVPSNRAAEEADVKLVLINAAGAPRLELTDSDDALTSWLPASPTTLPTGTPTAAVYWAPFAVIDGEDTPTAHTYYYPDAASSGARVGRIVDVPVGKTSTQCPNSADWTVDAQGCVALDITYGTSSTAPEATGQVQTVTARLWDPTANAIVTIPVAAYEYDTLKRLVKVTDPRPETDLVTRYGWDGTSTRLATVTPAGLAPHRVFYDTGSPGAPVKLVTRDTPTPGTNWTTTTLTSPPAGSTALARYVYGVTPSGNGTALPNLATNAVAAWYQNASPTTGFAVFGPDYPWDGTITGTAPENTSTSWRYADLYYTTSDGYTVNTAAYGAGAWLNDVTEYDSDGNTTRTLSPGATTTIRTASAVEDRAAVSAMSTQTFYASDGAVTEILEPARDTQQGSLDYQQMRRRTVIGYDENPPNNSILDPATGEAYRLPTSETVYATDSSGNNLATTSRTETGYAPVVAGDTSGWETGLPTTTTQVDFVNNGVGNITRATRYDDDGRVVESRQPSATTTSDAGTTRTQYYTGTGSGTCAGRPGWDGMVCRTYPGGSPTGSIGDLPETVYTYDTWGGVATVTEKVGATILRTTTITADELGLPTLSVTDVNATAVPGSTSRPGQTIAYDAATGMPTEVGRVGVGGSIVQTYDGWARPVTYTNDMGDSATTTYSGSGNVNTITDNKGVQTYTWDGPDATGAEERRGIPTMLTVTRGGTAGLLTYTGAYDPDGNMTLQTMPGALRQVQEFNDVGDLTELTYSGQVTPVTEQVIDGVTTWVPGTALQNQPWLTWTRRNDIDGRVTTEWNGAGAAFDGVPGVTDATQIGAPSIGEARAGDKLYGYDHSGRLTYVADRTATSTGILLEGGQQPTPAAPCQVRRYNFDKNGNRTQLKTTTNTDGDCDGTPGDSTTTYAYDSADRPTSGANGAGAYVYDALGRQTSLPEADAPNPTIGNITLGYFDDDLPRSISQDTMTTIFQLDPVGRRQTSTTSDSSSNSSLTRHYTGPSDNPSWTSTNSGTVVRNTASLTSVLGGLVDSDGSSELVLADHHGDHVASVVISGAQSEVGAATAIDGWTTYTEFGATEGWGTDRYGHLGQTARETSTETSGLTLMGVRLYVPTRGNFTGRDPVLGGNSSSYAYPNDPVNQHDVSGLFSARWWTFTRKYYLSALYAPLKPLRKLGNKYVVTFGAVEMKFTTKEASVALLATGPIAFLNTVGHNYIARGIARLLGASAVLYYSTATYLWDAAEIAISAGLTFGWRPKVTVMMGVAVSIYVCEEKCRFVKRIYTGLGGWVALGRW